MRGLLVFSKSPEQIAFYSVDRELEDYIRRKYEERTDPLPDQVNPCMIDMPCGGMFLALLLCLHNVMHHVNYL